MSLLVALQGAAPVPPDEHSDGWWAGVQQCFVAVPIAAALAGLALSASLAYGYQQQTEDLVPQPQVVISEDDAQLAVPAPPGPRFLYLPDPDDIPAGVLFGTPDEIYGWSPPPVRTAAPWAPPWTVDDDLPVAPADDDSGWFPPTVLRAPVIQSLAWDDQAIPAAPAVADDDSGWFPPLVPRAPIIQGLAWDDDIPAGVLFGTPDEIYGWSPPLVRSAAPYVPPWPVDDDLPVAPVVALEDDSAWSPPIVLRVPVVSSLIWDDQVVPAIADDDAGWWSPPIVLRPVIQSLAWDDETIPSAPAVVDDDSGWVPPLARPIPASPALWWDDGQATPTPAGVGPPDEDYWQVSTPGPVPPRFIYLPDPELLPAGFLFGVPDDDAGWTPPWIVRVAPTIQVWTIPDELPGVVVVFSLDEGEGWTPTPARSAAQPPQPWAVPDEFSVVVTFSLDEGEGWTPTPARSSAPPPQPWTVADDLPIAPADADAWSAPFVIRVAPLTLVWAVADDVPPIPLRIEEDYWWRAYSLPPVLVASTWTVDLENAVPLSTPVGGYIFFPEVDPHEFKPAGRPRVFGISQSPEFRPVGRGRTFKPEPHPRIITPRRRS